MWIFTTVTILFLTSVSKGCKDFCRAERTDYACKNDVRGHRNPGTLLPYGEDFGDTVVTGNNSCPGGYTECYTIGPIAFWNDFLGRPHKEAFISVHGFVRFVDDVKYFDDQDFSRGDPNDYIELKDEKDQGKRSTIAPYWADFELKGNASINYRLMDSDQMARMPDIFTNDYNRLFEDVQAPGDRYWRPFPEIREALVVTWSRIQMRTYQEGISNDRENTFQAVIMIDVKGDTHVVFNYGDIEQAGFELGGSSSCGNFGHHFPLIGLVSRKGLWEHTYSETEKAALVDDTTNTMTPGRWMMPHVKNGIPNNVRRSAVKMTNQMERRDKRKEPRREARKSKRKEEHLE